MIFIAAGHYPAKPGARYGRFNEHDEAVVWRDLMVSSAERHFIKVVDGTLRDKISFINERCMDGDVAVEIHFNAAKDADGNNVGRGSETLYYPGSELGEELARACQAELAEVFPPDRGVKEGWYRGNREKGAYFFLERTRCPAVIVEPEFVHRADVIAAGREDACLRLAGALLSRLDRE